MSTTEGGFYLTLPSDGSKKEFPSNTSNNFKIRLPSPIQLPGKGWKVGLSSLSMPDTKLHLPIFSKPADESKKGPVPIFQMKWSVFRKWNAQENFEANYELSEVKQIFEGIDGVGFMKSMVTFFDQKRLIKAKQVGNIIGPTPGDDYTKDGDPNQRRYIKFKWDGDELLTDNEGTLKDDRARPCLRINKYFAEKMGWIVKHPTDDQWVLGPNLKLVLFTDKVPDPAHVRSDCLKHITSSSGFSTYKTLFWCSDGDYWKLSYYCNWRFMNLNRAFQKLVGTTARSLFVYSDVAQSSVVGGKVTDLLREINYARRGEGAVYFEPTHIQYIPVRSTTLDIIETQIAETDGPLAEFKFGEGRAIVTLHFKQQE